MFIRTRINPVPGGAKVALRAGISGGKREFSGILEIYPELAGGK
jgi:hypothetical protein